MRYRVLPNGRLTTSIEEYVKAWRDKAKPIEEALGLKLVTFDPNLDFIDPKTNYSIQLPFWFVDKLSKKLVKPRLKMQEKERNNEFI